MYHLNVFYYGKEKEFCTTATGTVYEKTSEEQLLPVYYEPATKDTPNAVFRTAAEISARLSFLGNIRQPMELRQLGKLMSAKGFVQVRVGHSGKRGHIVSELTNNKENMCEIKSELVTTTC
ncbi:MAG: hypothetical protein MJZ64_01075 [Paludibacteraceae bacterium]|nr:hypothetical protein [Paludibacteraceae bacterium]